MTLTDNSTFNGSVGMVQGHVPFWRHPPYLTVLYCGAYWLIFSAGLLGNMLVIAAFIYNKTMRQVTSYFITSLAVADLLVILFCLPTTFTNNVLIEWHLGQFFCKFSVWINSTSVCASVYTLVAVAVDRYFAICHPIPYSKFRPIKTLVVIIPIWLWSGILFWPDLRYYQHDFHIYDKQKPPMSICSPKFPSLNALRTYFLAANVTFAFAVPLSVIVACYSYIYCTYVQKPSLGSGGPSVSAKAASMHTQSSHMGRAQKVKMKITRMMVLIVIVFTCSWLPFYCFFAYVLFGGLQSQQSSNLMSTMRAVLQWLTLANSCWNPAMYAYFSKTYRQSFIRMLSSKCMAAHSRTVENQQIRYTNVKTREISKFT